MRHFCVLTVSGLLLAACSSHAPLPMDQSAVSIWDVAPMSASLRQSGSGASYELTAGGEEHRGIARMRLYDAGKNDVVFVFPAFKSLDSFVLATKKTRFQCGTQRLEKGPQYSCTLNGELVADRVQVGVESIRVMAPAQIFGNGQPVHVEWLEFFR